MKTLRLGTRKSVLAQTQAKWVAARLQEAFAGLEIELVLITTTGDKMSSSTADASALSSSPPGDTSLPSSRHAVSRDPSFPGLMDPPLTTGGDDTMRGMDGGENIKGGLKALFTKELEDALLQKRIDLAVHSLKDMSAELPQGLVLGAVPERENPYDAWISKDNTPFSKLRHGARVGTGAARRMAQLKAARPDLEIVPLRGNVDTRLRKLQEEHLDGIILAAAGLKRLGRAKDITEVLSPEVLLPAIGQGALALEVRKGDAAMAPYLKAIDHAPSHQAVLAERAFLKGLGGSCQTPIAGHAVLESGSLVMKGMVLSPDGKEALRAAERGRPFDAAGVGERLAAQLLSAGAGKLLHD